MTVEVRVGGVPMHALGVVRDLSWSHGWPGGCLTASWSMAGLDSRALPKTVRRGVRVEIGEHGWPIWTGTLNDFESVDQFAASGLSRAGEKFPCAKADGSATTDLGGVTGAVRAQIITNGMPWAYDPVLFAGLPPGLGTVDEYQTIASALTAALTAVGQRWGVDARGSLFFGPDPAVPSYHTYVPVLGRADDSYFTHLIGRFVTAVDAEGRPTAYDTVTYQDTAAAARDGIAFRIVDLTDFGVLTADDAEDQLEHLTVLGGSRVGYSQRIEVAAHDLLRADGSPAYLPLVKAGDMVRLHGALAPESTYTGQTYVDVAIGETSYTHGSGRIVLAPVGLEARTLPDIIKAL